MKTLVTYKDGFKIKLCAKGKTWLYYPKRKGRLLCNDLSDARFMHWAEK